MPSIRSPWSTSPASTPVAAAVAAAAELLLAEKTAAPTVVVAAAPVEAVHATPGCHRVEKVVQALSRVIQAIPGILLGTEPEALELAEQRNPVPAVSTPVGMAALWALRVAAVAAEKAEARMERQAAPAAWPSTAMGTSRSRAVRHRFSGPSTDSRDKQ